MPLKILAQTILHLGGPYWGVRKLILNKGHNFISQDGLTLDAQIIQNMIQSLFLALGEISLTAQGDAKNYYMRVQMIGQEF